MVTVVRRCLRDINGTHIYQLGGPGHQIKMVANAEEGENALRRIDSLSGGLMVNFLGQFMHWKLPPPSEITRPDVLEMLRNNPRDRMRTTLQGGIQEALSRYRPDFHYIQAYLLAPEPYLEGWRMDLKTGRVWQVPVEVTGIVDWEW